MKNLLLNIFVSKKKIAKDYLDLLKQKKNLQTQIKTVKRGDEYNDYIVLFNDDYGKVNGYTGRVSIPAKVAKKLIIQSLRYELIEVDKKINTYILSTKNK